MSEPEQGPVSQSPRRRGAFTAVQLILFAGAAVVALAALLAAGLALGLALAGAAVIAVLVLAVWFIAANLVDGERPVRRRDPR